VHQNPAPAPKRVCHPHRVALLRSLRFLMYESSGRKTHHCWRLGAGQYVPQGSCLGSEEFRQELLAQVSQLASPRHAGEGIRDSALAKANRITQEELKRLGWTHQDLQGRRKSDPQKVRIAVRLRSETTMTLQRIAERLCMGAPTHAASLSQRHNQKAQSSAKTLF